MTEKECIEVLEKRGITWASPMVAICSALSGALRETYPEKVLARAYELPVWDPEWAYDLENRKLLAAGELAVEAYYRYAEDPEGI